MLRKGEIYKIDYLLVVTVILTAVIGILMVYSAGFDPVDKVNSGLYKKQVIWFLVGFAVMIALTFLNYKQLGDYSLYIYGFFILLLLLTFVVGKPIRNTRAWISFGAFSLQPSEFMKLGVIILLSKYLELRERDIRDFKELLVPSVVTLVPILVILLQPDFGTAMIFIPLLFTLLFVGGADVTHLLSIISIAAIALLVPMIITYREWVGDESSNLLLNFFRDYRLLLMVSGVLLAAAVTAKALHFFFLKKYYRRVYIPATIVSLGLFFSVAISHFLKDYQKKRILVFLNPDLDPHGSGYNIIQSKIAIGSGGLTGKGFLNGSQSQLGFLPEKSSDFIFSVVAEEWGFLGSVFLLVLLGIIVFRAIQISFQAKDKFGALLAGGIASLFFFHILINIGMV
ncbi:MAG TPA: rod shape-determining protein RodA, partial [Spirochaetes bacterium]|nr:rod shape-determining protein RodA [Spirochaetota bacterium]